MRYFRRGGGGGGNNPNTLVGLFLLMVLAIFAGPNALPRLIGDAVPGLFDQIVACSRLRLANDRARHQSLIARTVSAQTSPISVQVDPDDIPSAITPDAVLTIRIIVINETIGTVPLVFPGQVIVGDNPALSGLGVIFNPVGTVQGPAAPQGGLIPDSNIRLLGPRQRCVERITFTPAQFAQAGITATSRVKAYYRNISNGQVAGGPGSIFSDAGLWVGAVESATVDLRVAPAAP